jgi:uncharacterized small protein (DUF1192 family)
MIFSKWKDRLKDSLLGLNRMQDNIENIKFDKRISSLEKDIKRIKAQIRANSGINTHKPMSKEQRIALLVEKIKKAGL